MLALTVKLIPCIIITHPACTWRTCSSSPDIDVGVGAGVGQPDSRCRIDEWYDVWCMAYHTAVQVIDDELRTKMGLTLDMHAGCTALQVASTMATMATMAVGCDVRR